MTVVLRSVSAALRSRIRVATGQPVLGPESECVRDIYAHCSQDERKALPHSDNENTPRVRNRTEKQDNKNELGVKTSVDIDNSQHYANK